MDLPNSTLVLVLGILSLIFCWCYGFVGLILGIIAVVLSGSPDVCTGKILKIISRLHTKI